jgi:hypothetical protein
MSSKKKELVSNWLSHNAISLGLFAFTFCVSIFFGTRGFDHHHQGIMFNGAVSFFSDKGAIYRDFYYHYGPLAAGFHALGMLIFGQKLISLLYVTSLFYALATVQIYKILKLQFSVPFATFFSIVSTLLAPYYFWIYLPWSSVISIPIFLLIFRRLLTQPLDKNTVLISLCLTAIFFIRQSSGLINLMGIIGTLLLTKFHKPIFKILSYHILSVLFVYLFFHWMDILPHYFQLSFTDQIKWTSNHISSENLLLKLLKDVFIRPATTGYFFFNLMALSWFAITFKYFLDFIKGQTTPSKILMIAFIWASISQMTPVTCDRHFYWAMLPTFPILILQIKEILSQFPWIARFKLQYLYFIVITISLTGEIYHRMTYGIKKITYYNHKIYPEKWPVMNGIYTDETTSHFLDSLSQKWTKADQFIKSKEDYSLIYYFNRKDFNNINSDKVFHLNQTLPTDSLFGFKNWEPPMHSSILKSRQWFHYQF